MISQVTTGGTRTTGLEQRRGDGRPAGRPGPRAGRAADPRPLPLADYFPSMSVSVTSEIGRLRTVLVHTPGPELLAVTPDTREDFLYNYIIEVETARREHQRFIAILE